MQSKIVPVEKLLPIVRTLRLGGTLIAFTNGCFDLLHAGHVTLFQEIRSRIGHAPFLIVGVNSDSSVRTLKGHSRPINTGSDRMLVVSALRDVDAVTPFEDLRVTNLLRVLQPDYWFKGGDYTIESLDHEEREAVQSYGGRIEIIPSLPGRSTTSMLASIH